MDTKRKQIYLMSGVIIASILIVCILGFMTFKTNIADAWSSTKQMNVLVMGEDKKGDLDTAVLVTFNRGKESIKMVEIPSDTYVYGSDKKSVKSMKELLKNGGIEEAKKAVEVLLGVPVTQYVKVEYEGFKKVIDGLGGVQVEVGESFIDKNSVDKKDMILVEKGSQKLNGEEALAYMRTNKIKDVQKTQRILESIIKEVVHKKDPEAVKTLLEHVKTNVTPTQMMSVYQTITNAKHLFSEKITLQKEAVEYNGKSYLLLNEKHVQEVSKKIEEQMK